MKGSFSIKPNLTDFFMTISCIIITESSIRSNPLNPFSDGTVARKRKLEEETSNGTPIDTPSTSKDSMMLAGPSTSKDLPSFWIPSLTPKAKATLVKKPVSCVSFKLVGRDREG